MGFVGFVGFWYQGVAWWADTIGEVIRSPVWNFFAGRRLGIFGSFKTLIDTSKTRGRFSNVAPEALSPTYPPLALNTKP